MLRYFSCEDTAETESEGNKWHRVGREKSVRRVDTDCYFFTSQLYKKKSAS